MLAAIALPPPAGMDRCACGTRRAASCCTSGKATSGDIWAIAFSPDGTKLATGGTDGAVKIWDETGNLLATYLGHKNAVDAIAFNHDGTLLGSGGRDGAVRIWRME